MSNHMTITTEDALKVARRLVAYHGYPGEAADARLVARALLSSSAAERGMREALSEMVYETTHLSSREDDGSHICKISGATLAKARAALSGIEPGEDEQARGQGRSAPISTDTKDTSK